MTHEHYVDVLTTIASSTSISQSELKRYYDKLSDDDIIRILNEFSKSPMAFIHRIIINGEASYIITLEGIQWYNQYRMRAQTYR